MVKIAMVGLIGVVVAAVLSLVTISGTLAEIQTKMESIKTLRTSQFLVTASDLEIGQLWSRLDLNQFFEFFGFKEKKNLQEFLPGDFYWDLKEEGLLFYQPEPAFSVQKHPARKIRFFFERQGSVLKISDMVDVEVASKLSKVSLGHKAVASYSAGRIRTQKVVPLSDVPLYLRQAVMAIEDNRFLSHHGMSMKAILRAFYRNIVDGRASQGGSTITQQLMKNLFLDQKKTLSRKVKEAFYALITELKYSKEDILEVYLNEVYLGQFGTHEIHGMSEAARFFFNREIQDITLPQAAMLAGIIQAPNALDPRKNTDRVLKRRNIVLKRMLEENFILEEEYFGALNEPLGLAGLIQQSEDVQYFIDYVLETIPTEMKPLLDKQILNIYLTLRPWLQSKAAISLSQHLETLQKSEAALQKRYKKGVPLQGALVAIDPARCQLLAIQGGTKYRSTQFNRVFKAKRQPGSLLKPFVVLSALRQDKVTPATLIDDAPFQWDYDNQQWMPKNYDGKFRGPVSVRQTLELSLNVPTVKIAKEAGVSSIVQTLKLAGIQSSLPDLPSIALGAAEVTPLEMAQAYATLANLGDACQAFDAIEKITDENGNLLFEPKAQRTRALEEVASFQTVEMLKGTFIRGTAKGALGNFEQFAGKTGTTNEAKDAWFVGFSPSFLVLVWVGYDTEDKVGLTGARAALPVWMSFVNSSRAFFEPKDFVPGSRLKKCKVTASPGSLLEIEEYFKTGTEPTLAECVDFP